MSISSNSLVAWTVGGLLAWTVGVQAQDPKHRPIDAQKLLEKHIDELAKDNPAAAAMLREAIKGLKGQGSPSSSSGPLKSGGFAKASGSASASGSGDKVTTTESTFSITNQDGRTELKASENGVSYEIVGSLQNPNDLTITIRSGGKQQEFRGLDSVPGRLRPQVERLIKRATE